MEKLSTKCEPMSAIDSHKKKGEGGYIFFIFLVKEEKTWAFITKHGQLKQKLCGRTKWKPNIYVISM